MLDREALKRSFSAGTFLFSFTTQVRDLLIDFLQVLFKYHDLTAKYRYDDDIEKTKVLIGSVYPLEERYFPRILVQCDVVSESRMALGDIGKETSEYFEVIGRFDYEVGIVISALEDNIVKDLADLVLLFLANPLYRKQLTAYGIAFKENEGYRVSNLTRVNYTQTLSVFELTIKFGLWAEWIQQFEHKGITVTGNIIELSI